ncbi:uncharacterized protein SPSK_05692 [Sporothrix schenckii 1099-18]|uniref:Uncharacterized protein n=1 Tax=Sporothrix schenckii 1099-18 TaxID=1397361 RepID=A0A0F2LVZ4_SPOSC|nr:uncharacterized protein SPSK_05692 [Sporothrix schenckii 1099-18]KJR80999.1 hypothetical protein SPSK_05692 [Sporothrix schenckii 1099-18]
MPPTDARSPCRRTRAHRSSQAVWRLLTCSPAIRQPGSCILSPGPGPAGVAEAAASRKPADEDGRVGRLCDDEMALHGELALACSRMWPDAPRHPLVLETPSLYLSGGDAASVKLHSGTGSCLA